MRFTPSQQWTTYANSSAYALQWHVYVRVVTDLSLSNSGYSGWTEVSRFISTIPDITEEIEYNTGQFLANSIQLEAMTISWWNTNVFTDAVLTDSTKYIEFKIECNVGINQTFATDSPILFSGFVAKDKLEYDELTDSVKITVQTVEDIGSKIAAENISVQYLNNDCTGVGGISGSALITGSILLNLPNVFVITASNLNIGTHQITYNYNKGNPYFKLDTGDNAYVIADSSASYVTVVNQNNQNCTLYYNDISIFDQVVGDITNEIIITTASNQFCNSWPASTRVDSLLTDLYTVIGIPSGSLVFDTLSTNTYTSTNFVVSPLDVPPNNSSVSGLRNTVCGNTAGTFVYVGVGNNLYKRNTTTGVYTLLKTYSAGMSIYRLFFTYPIYDGNPSNIINNLWIVYGVNYTNLLTEIYNEDNNTFYGTTSLTYEYPSATGSQILPNSMTFINWTGTASGSLLYTTSTVKSGVGGTHITGSVRQVSCSGNTCVDKVITSGSMWPVSFGYYVPQNDFLFHDYYANQPLYSQSVYLKATSTVDTNNYLCYLKWNNSTNKFDVSGSITPALNILNRGIGAYSANDAAYYFYDGDDQKIKMQTTNVGLLTLPSTNCYGYSDISNCTGFINPLFISPGINNNDRNVYFTGVYSGSINGQKGFTALFSIINYTASYVCPAPLFKDRFTNSSYNNTLKYPGLYYIDSTQTLQKTDNKFNYWSNGTSLAGKSITDSIRALCNSFNLVTTVKPNKTAYVFRRSDSNGNPITNYTIGQTTSSLSLTLSKANNITVANDKPKCSLVKISAKDTANNTYEATYNGTAFESAVLPFTVVADISADYCSSTVADNFAYFDYQYFSVNRKTYTIIVPYPLHQFEVFDNVNINFIGNKLPLTRNSDGYPIQKITHKFTGDTEITVYI